MTDKPNDGGPAFPVQELESDINDNQYISASHGMSLLDHFAGLAMHAELSTAGMECEAAHALRAAALANGQTVEQRIACNSYGVAEAMLAERERRKQP